MKPKITKDLVEFYKRRLISRGKILFNASIITSLFLVLIYLNSTVFKMNFVLIGVFQELFTIPSISVQPLLLFLSLRIFIRTKFKVKSYTFFALIVSLVTLILTWGSFIITKF
ncbi:hypothetical protein L3X37_11030 [Sabulilitoribacter arenilitoris]|uniref:Uncharacterized protein n=1 Tax=Wocania arenilitoris TaxID=2044858 RepID=A0AAE3EQR5_9FLAO|nr:hypothetical protein [Wocania arenilitoris]MCF7568892.1 hypothetical protein [Wocania arenilitoris]